jgi:hypothetical protein
MVANLAPARFVHEPMATSRPTELTVDSQPSNQKAGKTRSPLAHSLSVAKPLGPEDVRRGDFVAVLDEMYELPSYWWCEDAALHPRDELVRIRLIPAQHNLPLKVKSVCLPFVLAKPPFGLERTLDLRRTRLARLDKHFAAATWKAYKKQRHAKNSKRSSCGV